MKGFLFIAFDFLSFPPPGGFVVSDLLSKLHDLMWLLFMKLSTPGHRRSVALGLRGRYSHSFWFLGCGLVPFIKKNCELQTHT